MWKRVVSVASVSFFFFFVLFWLLDRTSIGTIETDSSPLSLFPFFRSRLSFRAFKQKRSTKPAKGLATHARKRVGEEPPLMRFSRGTPPKKQITLLCEHCSFHTCYVTCGRRWNNFVDSRQADGSYSCVKLHWSCQLNQGDIVVNGAWSVVARVLYNSLSRYILFSSFWYISVVFSNTNSVVASLPV